jgi:hypothetical protein
MSDSEVITRADLEARIKSLLHELAELRLSRKCAMDRDKRERPPISLLGWKSEFEDMADTITLDIKRRMLDLENVRDSLRHLKD